MPTPKWLWLCKGDGSSLKRLGWGYGAQKKVTRKLWRLRWENVLWILILFVPADSINSTVVDLMLKFKSNLLLVVLVALRWFLCKSCCMILLLNHSISRVFDLAASKNEDKPNWLVSHMSIPKKDMFEGVIRVIKFSRKHPAVNFHIRVASGIRGCAIGGGLCVCVQS